MAPKKVIRTVLDSNETLAAFLVEGEEEYITKEEAVRLAQRGEIQAKVVTPKGKKPYIREVGNKNKGDNFRKLAVKHCGPEIGEHLRKALYACQRKFQQEWRADFDKKRKMCSSLVRSSLKSPSAVSFRPERSELASGAQWRNLDPRCQRCLDFARHDTFQTAS